jgi:hypothetical protein
MMFSKINIRRIASTFALLPVALVAPSFSTPVAAEEGWIELFDGKSLDGWHKNPQKIGHGTGGQWTVEDGAIVGQQDPPGSGNGGILLTDRKFKNFEVSIDLKPDWGICSGFFLRSTDQGKCLQMMVDYHDAGDVGHVYGEGTGGFNTRPFNIYGVYENEELKSITARPVENAPALDYTCTGEEWIKAWKVNDWNTARVVVTGSPAKVGTWINGQKVIEWDGTKYADPKYDAQKVIDVLGDEGSIAVQVHGGKSWPVGAKCRWKNIKVKVLP